MSRAARLLVLGLSVLAARCTCSPLAVDSVIYQCQADADCGAGFRCLHSVCISSSGDGGLGDAGCSEIELCANGFDDTCDGLADCKDPSCASAQCAGPGAACVTDGGCVCSGNGGTPELTELSCADGFDNDCDGNRDCFDPDCASKSCDLAATMTCQGSSCLCAPDAGVKGQDETNCANGKDDNCNGLVDCEEPTCDGRTCSTSGGQCSGTSCACFGNGGVVEKPEATCDDGHDNDCDGLIDCQDQKCRNKRCGPNGRACSGVACTCAGNGGTPQVTESACGDSFDNDCDGLPDCKDPDCVDDACSVTGKQCQGGLCTCTAGGGVVQGSETLCSDGKDNDCDGLTDCADPSCNAQFCGGATKTCSANSCQCSVPGGGTPEVSETLCNDNKDNDCDGKSDCDDSKCNTKLCGPNGRQCSAGTCTCTGAGGTFELNETSCGDGKDNDCNGLTDCDDSNCVNRRCAPAGTCCAGRGCVAISTTSDCSGCGLACGAGQRCTLMDAVQAGYKCSCASTALTCPSGTGGAQACDNTYCNCADTAGTPSSQCGPEQACATGGFCTFKP